jgi:hypothetical protein
MCQLPGSRISLLSGRRVSFLSYMGAESQFSVAWEKSFISQLPGSRVLIFCCPGAGFYLFLG